MQQPLHVVNQVKKRALIPKISVLIILGIIFYLGILLNLTLLELETSLQSTIELVSSVIVLLLVLIGIIIGIRKATKKYQFFNTNLLVYGKTIPYNTITNTAPKQNWLDKMFKTYSIQLTDKITMRNIPEAVQLEQYLKQMISYSGTQF